MKYILTAITVFIFSHGQSQINWQKTTNWRIYRITGKVLFSVSIDSLNVFKSYPLQLDSIVDFLDSVNPLPVDVKPVWMGGQVATYIYNGKMRKILISDYAGYFYDQTSGTYFQLSAKKKDDWIGYINSCLLSL
jgi:hypothetical protein